MWNQLEEVRSVARARAAEDFEYFVNTVLALHVPPEVCRSVQADVERNRAVRFVCAPHQQRLVEQALQAWLCVLGKSQEPPQGLNETFQWLFAQERAAA